MPEHTDRRQIRTGSLIVGLVVGVAVAVMIDAFATMKLYDAQNFYDFFQTRAWRVRSVVSPILIIVASAYAIRGKLRKAAWFVLGAAALRMFADVVQALRYWP